MRTKVPKSVHKKLSLVEVNAFKSYVHNHPHLDELPGLQMTPGELSRVCSARYLSDLHLSWVAEKLNSQQTETYVIFINFMTNVERFCERRILSRTNLPKNLVFIINVGMRTDSNTTYMGSDRVKGSHWTIALYDSVANTVLYGDSLGWPPPDNLEDKLSCYTEKVRIREWRLDTFCFEAGQRKTKKIFELLRPKKTKNRFNSFLNPNWMTNYPNDYLGINFSASFP